MTVIQFKSLSRDFYNFSGDSEPSEIGDFDTEEKVYQLTPENPLGPMNNSFSDHQITDLHKQFYILKQFFVSFSFRNLDIGGLAPIPYVWTITVSFERQGREKGEGEGEGGGGEERERERERMYVRGG
jgi:hypothetical protein